MVKNISRVAVVGAGLMGTQIAIQIASSGYRVFCYDISEEMLKSAEDFFTGWLAKKKAKGKIDDEESESLKKRLSFTSDIKEATSATDLVVEAVSDIVEIKRAVLEEIDALTPKDCIYASNSSYIVSSRFADAVADKSKVINTHFFNPALVMKIVEVVKGPHVSQETFDTAFQFIKSIGKTPIKIEKEIYGFVVNRIFSALTREACYLVDMGIATPEDIDIAVRGALGHSMGPLETLDMTGIDLEYNVYMERFRASGNKEDLPAACLSTMYGNGEYGRKNGKGFYNYNDK